MNCFIHTDKPSVIKCKRCGREMCQDCFEDNQKTGICPSCNIINKVKNLQNYQNSILYNGIVFGLFCVFVVLYIVNVALDMFSTVYLIIFSAILILFGVLATNLFFTNLKKLNKEKQDILLIQMANKLSRYQSMPAVKAPKLNKKLSVATADIEPVTTETAAVEAPAISQENAENKTATPAKRTSTKRKTTKKRKSTGKKKTTKKKTTSKKKSGKISAKKSTGKKSGTKKPSSSKKTAKKTTKKVTAKAENKTGGK